MTEAWARINVRNSDNSISSWELNDSGRLKHPPRRQRRRFETGPDNIRRPVQHQHQYPVNHTAPPAAQTNWQNPVRVEPAPLYDSNDSYSGAPEVLYTFDTELPGSYLLDEQYMGDDDPYFGGGDLIW